MTDAIDHIELAKSLCVVFNRYAYTWLYENHSENDYLLESRQELHYI